MGEPARNILEEKTVALKLVSQERREEKRHLEEQRRLREFGVLMAAVLCGISAYLLWKGRETTLITLTFATLFLIPAFLKPSLLKPVEKGWLWFGEKMSVVMTTILLVVTYYVVLTPIGLLLRLAGKDLLDKKLEPEAKTYWKEIEPNGPSTRPYLPY